MNLYAPEPPLEHGRLPAVGVLVTNLGTPDAPTTPALRRYLREFLGDPRVVEIPRWKWWLILNLFILPFRPRHSAALYRSVWQEDGSPLLTCSLRLGDALTETVGQTLSSPVHVAVGMRYGQPSIATALGTLRERGCTKLLVFPLFPQYSGTTIGAVFDAVAAELSTWRVVPDLRTIHGFHSDPGYVEELAASVREVWSVGGEPEKLLFSFHGIPLRYFEGGDPYHCQCHKTARLVAERLGLDESRYDLSFQSLFGKEEWLKPTTDVTVRAMARAGIKRLDVICPGFSVDCLETLEEIDQLNRGFFREQGGERFRYIPCLNDRPGHVRVLSDLVIGNLQGWVRSTAEWDPDVARDEALASRRRAEEMMERGTRADGGYGRG